MTYGEAKQQGYKNGDVKYFQGYISRRVNVNQQPIKTAKGNREGELYVELPCWKSTQYAYRQYLIPPKSTVESVGAK